MKKILFLAAILLGVAQLSETKAASAYSVNDAELTASFDAAETVTSFAEAQPSAVALPVAAPQQGGAKVSQKNQYVAAVIAWVVGGFGVHRHYLGTSSNMWAVYTFTCCGIAGLVPTVDLIVLLITDDVNQYVGNEDFFMW